jgi:uncharacterized protein (AIM24 family)
MADQGREDQGREEEFYYLLTEGSELLQAGKVDDARKHFERALEMNPSHEQALNLLGLSLFRLNHLDRARQIFAELVHNNPIEPSLRLNLAMVHLKTGHLAEAKLELERVLELSADHPRATSYMGLVLERQGDLDRAAIYYEKAGNKKRADEIRAFRPTQTGTFPLPNLRQLVSQPPTAAPGPAAMAASAPPSPAPTATPSTPPTPAASAPPSASTTPSGVPAPITAVTSLSSLQAVAAARPNAEAEAAALTAASASHLRRPAEPPAPAHVESARGGSLGYTIEVEDGRGKPAAAAASSATSALPRTSSSVIPAAATSTPPQAAATTPPTAVPAATTPPTATLSQLPVWSSVADAMREERLADLVAQSAATEAPSRRGDDGAVSFPVPDVGYVRTDLVVALAGAFEIEPVHRRYRGKRTDSLFGGADQPLIALLGKGMAYLAPDKLSLRLVALKNEEIYLVEGSLVAFSQGLVWENGRLPSETDRDLDIVHLRGSGRMLLGTKAPLLALQVRADQPVTVHASRLVGWNGQLVPYRAPLPGLPDAAKRVPVVRFEGTGVVLAL